METSLSGLVRSLLAKHPKDDPKKLADRLVAELGKMPAEQVSALVRPALVSYVRTEYRRSVRSVEHDAYVEHRGEIAPPSLPELPPAPVKGPMVLTEQISEWLKDKLYVRDGYKPVTALTVDDLEWRIADLKRRRDAYNLPIAFLEDQLAFLKESRALTLGGAYDKLRKGKAA